MKNPVAVFPILTTRASELWKWREACSIRGDSFSTVANEYNSAYRYYWQKHSHCHYVGFRIVRNK